MRIFLSYASVDRASVEPVYLALTAERSNDVFFDRASLPPGEEYDARIRQAIKRAELFIFFVTPEAIDIGSYTLSELAIASQTWPHPDGRVLPVMLKPTSLDALPAYLKAVTVLEPKGNITADVADTVERIEAIRRRMALKKLAATAAGVSALIAVAVFAWLYRQGSFSTSSPETISAKDGAPLRLIPAGAFVMGDDEASPKREVYLDAFYIDKFEITLGRYAAFMKATGNVHSPEGWPDDAERNADLPVVGVDWQDADAYCRWADRRLPTDAEWEKAARDGDERIYPWGNDAPTAERAVSMKVADGPYAGGVERVGSHPAGASSAGVDDLAGNAAEWVADWYSESFAVADVRNPKGPASGTSRTIRGSGWQDGGTRMASARRWHAQPDTRGDDIGFRCARDAR